MLHHAHTHLLTWFEAIEIASHFIGKINYAVRHNTVMITNLGQYSLVH